jgi:hypothetical protein
MLHPYALAPMIEACRNRTVDAARKSAELDNRLAASDSEIMDCSATSRDAVAHSRGVLRDLKVHR